MSGNNIPFLILLGTVLLMMIGCGTRSTTTDPEALQARFTASKVAERQMVRDVIGDTARASSFLLLLDERDVIVSNYADVVENYIEEMRVLNADYEASREDFERLLTNYREARQSYQRDLVAVIQQMKAATQQNEWKRLAKFQLQELNPRETIHVTGGV